MPKVRLGSKYNREHRKAVDETLRGPTILSFARKGAQMKYVFAELQHTKKNFNKFEMKNGLPKMRETTPRRLSAAKNF